MYVPNYIPEPLEVPGNVSEEPYANRLKFVRRVTTLHSIGLIVVGGLAMLPLPQVGIVSSLVTLSVMLLLLDFWRIMHRGKPIEPRCSALALPVVLFTAAWVMRELTWVGQPVWAIFAGPAFTLLYTLISGRDYSFVGGGIIAGIFSSVGVAYIANVSHLRPLEAGLALLYNALYLVFYVYDLASLMQRRRTGEELAAVVDLYRDVFNVFGYIPRVISHWRRHRIWNLK